MLRVGIQKCAPTAPGSNSLVSEWVVSRGGLFGIGGSSVELSLRPQRGICCLRPGTNGRGEQQIPHGLKAVCVNCVVPEGTRIYFPLHPALRLRLRAGLNYFAPTALDFRPSSSTNKYQVWFSPMLKRPFVMTTQNRETGHYYAAPIAWLLSIRQIGPADAIVPAEGIHIYKCPEQAHDERSRGEIESHNAMATLTLARRFSFEGAEANLGYAHTRGGSAIDQQQVLIDRP